MQEENSYVIKNDSTELARLVLQDQLFTRAIGGLFPDIEVDGIKKVLDLACGPAGWAIEVASQFPEMEVVGIDINATVVNYNFAQSLVRRLQNVTFEVMDVKKPLNYRDNSFDLVNGRFMVGFLDQDSWPRLLEECKRILRSGGIICLTESEYGLTNSAALAQLQQYLFQALASQKRTFSIDRLSLGICHMFSKMLRDAGFVAVEQRPFILEASSGQPLHYPFIMNGEIAYSLLKPYLIESGVVEEEEFNRQYHQMLIDFNKSDFINLGFGLTTWARKPPE